MIEPLLLSLGLFGALVLSAFSSGAETGVYCLDRVRLRVRSEQKRADALRLSRLMDRQEDLVITTLIGTNIADYLATVCVTALLLGAALNPQAAELYATAILTPLILVFGGVLPKDLFARRADRLMYALSTPLACARQLAWLTGTLWLLRSLTRWLIRRIDPSHEAEQAGLVPRARIQRLLHEGATSGGLSPYQRDTIERVMKISKVRLANVMVPRARAALISLKSPRHDLLRIARMAHFSRLPVYRDDPRQIVGIINVYGVLMDTEQRPVVDYVQPATFLSANETVPGALVKLQEARQVMGIVVDGRGNCVGLFTMKDLVEEIVGELQVW